MIFLLVLFLAIPGQSGPRVYADADNKPIIFTSQAACEVELAVQHAKATEALTVPFELKCLAVQSTKE